MESVPIDEALERPIEWVYPLIPQAQSSNIYKGLSPLEPPTYSIFWLLVSPLLEYFKLYTPPDPTHGRYLLPPQHEERYLPAHPFVHTTRRRIFTSPPTQASHAIAEHVRLVPEEVVSGRGRDWVFWQSWELKDRRGKRGEGVDMMLVHGIGDYGSRYAVHIANFVSDGFRLIAPDLPNHGHSSGLHCHITSTEQLTSSLRLVFEDVASLDADEGRPSPSSTFFAGASLGAFVILKYLVEYPPDVEENQSIEGCYLMCPLIDVAAESRPSKTVESIARVLQIFAGRVPIAQAQRGKGHNDPRVELAFLANPHAYHGALRISTGLTLMRGLLSLPSSASTLHLPSGFKVIHGKQDRITNPQATIEFFEQVKGARVEVWDGYEHIMNKTGWDEEDDKPRQKVLVDWYNYIVSCL